MNSRATTIAQMAAGLLASMEDWSDTSKSIAVQAAEQLYELAWKHEEERMRMAALRAEKFQLDKHELKK